MAKKFISFLGTNDYTETTYTNNELDNSNYTSKYIQEAILNTVCKNWGDKDGAVIFITDEAEKLNWYNENDDTRRLKSSLSKLDIESMGIKIPTGKNVEEIWEIFDIVINNIEDQDEIVLDITHAFRYIPMLATVILDYAKAVKNAKIIGIYYGAWELRDTAVEPNIAPIFNLTSLSEIQEWSQAVNTFTRYGNSGHLKEISNMTLKPSLRTEVWAREANKFITKLNDFTMNISTCRGMLSDNSKSSKKSIQFATKEVKDSLKKFKTIDDAFQLKPIIPLVSKIEESISNFDENSILKTGLATIKWCIDNDLIQQAYTALEETLKTYICEIHNLDTTKYENRELIVNKAINKKTSEKRSEKGIELEDSTEEQKAINDKIREIAASLDLEFVQLAQKIKAKRNDINHFGFNDSAAPYDKLEEDIEKFYSEFINIINNKSIESNSGSKLSNKKMFLIFSHKLTELQKEDAKKSLNVKEFVYMPEELQIIWSNMNPECEKIVYNTRKIIDWIDANCTKDDYILVQGDYGATYHIVSYCKSKEFKPVYSTTKRVANELVNRENTVILTHEVSHVRFREY